MNAKKEIIATLIKAGRSDLANAVAARPSPAVAKNVSLSDVETIVEDVLNMGGTAYEEVITNILAPLDGLARALSGEAFEGDAGHDIDVMEYSYLFGKGPKRVRDAVETIKDTGKAMLKEAQKLQKDLKKAGVK